MTYVEVTGPGLEGRRAPSVGAALAVAVDRASRMPYEASFYVRCDGVIVGRADGDGQGRGWIAAGADVVEDVDQVEDDGAQLALVEGVS